jgi:hypothetical protein
MQAGIPAARDTPRQGAERMRHRALNREMAASVVDA